MTTIKLRRDTATNLSNANPILAEGEACYDLTNKVLKVGDGVTAYNDLPSISGGDTPSSVVEKYGIMGDYATHYGIIDCPNGLVNHTTATKNIQVQPGIVLLAAGNDTKTTIASEIDYTITSSENIVLFYIEGEVIEVHTQDVFYQTTEPDNGETAYVAWYNPEVGKWQFKSNDTGNVFREAIATPIANIKIDGDVITRIDYAGYRLLDDSILVDKTELETIVADLQSLINNKQDILTAGIGINILNGIELTEKWQRPLGTSITRPAAIGFAAGDTGTYYPYGDTYVAGNSIQIIALAHINMNHTGVGNFVNYNLGGNTVFGITDKVATGSGGFPSFIVGNVGVDRKEFIQTQGTWRNMVAIVTVDNLNKTTTANVKVYNDNTHELIKENTISIPFTDGVDNMSGIFSIDCERNGDSSWEFCFDRVEYNNGAITLPVTILSSSPVISTNSDVTLKGNTFNNANELVQLDSEGYLPVLDGSKLVNLPGYTDTEIDEMLALKADQSDLDTTNIEVATNTAAIQVNSEAIANKQDKLTAGEGIEIKQVYPDAIDLQFNFKGTPVEKGIQQVYNDHHAYTTQSLDVARSFKLSGRLPINSSQSNKLVGFSFSPNGYGDDVVQYVFGYKQQFGQGARFYEIGIFRNSDNARATQTKQLPVGSNGIDILLEYNYDTKAMKVSFKADIETEYTVAGTRTNGQQTEYFFLVDGTASVLNVGAYYPDVTMDLDLDTINFEYIPARDPYNEISTNLTPDLLTNIGLITSAVLEQPSVPTYDGTNVTIPSGTKVAIPNGKDNKGRPQSIIITTSSDLTINQATTPAHIGIKSDGTIYQTAWTIVVGKLPETSTQYYWYYDPTTNKTYQGGANGVFNEIPILFLIHYYTPDASTTNYFNYLVPISYSQNIINSGFNT